MDPIDWYCIFITSNDRLDYRHLLRCRAVNRQFREICTNDLVCYHSYTIFEQICKDAIERVFKTTREVKNGYFSEEAYKFRGGSRYKKLNGETVIVTNAACLHIDMEVNWKDSKYVGMITNWVEKAGVDSSGFANFLPNFSPEMNFDTGLGWECEMWIHRDENGKITLRTNLYAITIKKEEDIIRAFYMINEAWNNNVYSYSKKRETNVMDLANLCMRHMMMNPGSYNTCDALDLAWREDNVDSIVYFWEHVNNLR